MLAVGGAGGGQSRKDTEESKQVEMQDGSETVHLEWAENVCLFPGVERKGVLRQQLLDLLR